MKRHWISGVMGLGLVVFLQGCTGLSAGVSRHDHLTHDELRTMIGQLTREAENFRLKADRMQHMAEMYEAIASTSADPGEVERLTGRVVHIKEMAQDYLKSAEGADAKAAEHQRILFGVNGYLREAQLDQRAEPVTKPTARSQAGRRLAAQAVDQ